MQKELSHNIKLGLFVLCGTILLIFGLYSIGKNKNMFGTTFRLVSVFRDVSGLTDGNNVRYSGIDVGTIDKIEIINDSSVRVEMLIETNVRKFIRKNAIASIGTDGLMGNKLVNISQGTTSVPVVDENDEIASVMIVNTDDMLRTLDMTNSNILSITNNLKEMTYKMNRNKGTLFSVLTDTMMADNVNQSLRNIRQVSENLVELSNQFTNMANDIKQGKGTLGMVMRDTILPNDIRAAIKKLKEGSEQFSKITADVSEVVNQINSGNGIVNGLLKDSLMREDLRKSLSNLESATKKLDEDLEGMKHSFLLRGYFRDQEREKKNETPK